MAAHAILKGLAAYDAHALASIQARFSSPVYPGETLRFDLWRDGNDISFRAWVPTRDVKVLDNGYATLRPSQP